MHRAGLIREHWCNGCHSPSSWSPHRISDLTGPILYVESMGVLPNVGFRDIEVTATFFFCSLSLSLSLSLSHKLYNGLTLFVMPNLTEIVGCVLLLFGLPNLLAGDCLAELWPYVLCLSVRVLGVPTVVFCWSTFGYRDPRAQGNCWWLVWSVRMSALFGRPLSLRSFLRLLVVPVFHLCRVFLCCRNCLTSI